MIARLILIVVLVLNLSSDVFAQRFDPGKIDLSWEVLNINYQGKPQILAVLTLTNNSLIALPDNGWKIYFNSGRQVTDVKGNVEIEFLNGGLNSISPGKNFRSLQPGKSLRIEYVASGKAMNFTDAPSGFYWIWDAYPSEGFSIKKIVVKPLSAANSQGHITPEIIFGKNRLVENISEEELIKVFPTPVTYNTASGAFILKANGSINADASFNREADLLADDLKVIFGRKPSISSGIATSSIRLKKVDGLDKEAYQMNITPLGITISASEPAGIFYGIQSLKSMFPPESWIPNQRSLIIPAADIFDYPRFGYRAFMLDVARNFQPKKQILKVLDLMALYKLNVLHFHLNDDEGWRLEIPDLSELTEIGSKRAHTLNSKTNLPASYGSGPDVANDSGTGYYSKADFIEILKYATDRHIRVIPEVETPGHARAAIKSMDARYARLVKAGKKKDAEQYLLRDMSDQSVYRSVQKWNDNVMNVALPSTYTFIEKVVDEIREMYKVAGAPLATIHLGGDEVPAGVWEQSAAVKALKKNNPEIKSADDLWYYYFNKVNNILKSKSLYLSGWEELALRKTILDGKLRYIPNPTFANENFHAYVWNNVWGWGSEDLAYRLANSGYKTILAPVTNFYFDMAHQKDFDELGTYWATYIDIDAPFSFIPFDYYKNAKDYQGKPIDQSIFAGKERLTEFGKSNIVGLQSLLWTETVTSKEQLEYMLTPRLLAFAERSWSKEPEWAKEKDSVKSASLYNEAWSRFINVLDKRELPHLNNYAGGFNYRIPTAGAVIENGQILVNTQFSSFVIRYTSDNSEPTVKSRIVKNAITEKGIIKLRVFNAKGRGGRTTSLINK